MRGQGVIKQDPYQDFHGKGKASQGKEFKIGWFDNLSGLWAIGMLFSYLVPGPGVIKAEYCFPECTRQIGKVGFCMS